jgi:hypothetical protein
MLNLSLKTLIKYLDKNKHCWLGKAEGRRQEAGGRFTAN